MDNGLLTIIWLSCGVLGTLIACFKKVIRWKPHHIDKALWATLFGPIWLIVCLCIWWEFEKKNRESGKVIKKKVKRCPVNRFELMEV